VKSASAIEEGTFWELLDLSKSERKSCRTIWSYTTQISGKEREFLTKESPVPGLGIFSCNARNVIHTTLSTVITALMGE
jgi:hypothetical protein